MANLALLQKHQIPLDKYDYLIQDDTEYENLTSTKSRINKKNCSHLQKCILTIHPNILNYIKDYLRNISLQELNHVDKEGDCALHLAVTRCFKDNNDFVDDKFALKLIKLLLKSGANINQQDRNGLTPLYVACMYSNPYKISQCSSVKIVRLLLKSGADPNIADYRKFTPLQSSVERADTHSNYKTVRLLIKYGANVNAQNKYLWTPLHFACEFLKVNLRRVTKLLLISGANSDLENDFGSIPLNNLMSNFYHNDFKNKKVYKMLLTHGISEKAIKESGISMKIPKIDTTENIMKTLENFIISRN